MSNVTSAPAPHTSPGCPGSSSLISCPRTLAQAFAIHLECPSMLLIQPTAHLLQEALGTAGACPTVSAARLWHSQWLSLTSLGGSSPLPSGEVLFG